MPMSVTPPRSNRRSGGFTLLELVVVLALLGLATALVAPAGFRTIATWQRATDVDAAMGALVALTARARQEGHAFRFDAGDVDTEPLTGMPDGWTVHLDTPLVVQANGACRATRGELRQEGGYTRSFLLQPPFCRGELPESP